MDVKQLNQKLAQILVGNGLVSAETVRACAPRVTAGRNLGQILVADGLIAEEQYQKAMALLQRQLAPAQTGFSAPEPAQQAYAPAPQPTYPPQPVPASPSSSAGQGSGERRIGTKTHKNAVKITRESLPGLYREPSAEDRLPVLMPRALDRRSRLEDILLYARAARASDVHIVPYSPIYFRKFGRLEPYGGFSYQPDDIRLLFEDALNVPQLEELKTSGDLEMAYTIPGHGRYRLTFYEQRYGWEFAARIIDREVREFEGSGMPESCRGLTNWAQGLVLITGPLGCGKSSTMATLVEMINAERREHIITIENPIELIYTPKMSQITQREVGRHTLSPANALRGALRQDPDVLVVSELRDIETIRLAVSAAETGHLVFGTMNTVNAIQTISRLIDSFPVNEQENVRSMVSESLRGIISQQLIPLKDGSGIVPAYEVLIVNRAISNLIRKDAMPQMESAMMSGRSQGMVLLDQSLKDLVDRGQIEGEEAFFRASNPKNFVQFAPAELKVLADG